MARLRFSMQPAMARAPAPSNPFGDPGFLQLLRTSPAKPREGMTWTEKASKYSKATMDAY